MVPTSGPQGPVRECAEGDLDALDGGDVAEAGVLRYVVAFVPHPGRSCVVLGPVGVTGVRADGSRVPIRFTTREATAHLVRAVDLPPGTTTFVTLDSLHACEVPDSTHVYSQLELTLPGGAVVDVSAQKAVPVPELPGRHGWNWPCSAVAPDEEATPAPPFVG